MNLQYNNHHNATDNIFKKRNHHKRYTKTIVSQLCFIIKDHIFRQRKEVLITFKINIITYLDIVPNLIKEVAHKSN